MNKNILIVGVGGQGTLLASKLIGRCFMDSGYDIKVSEVHGMSQRGGSVVTYVRFGERVDSPVICEGEADIIVSFELLESARWLNYLKPDGLLISNTLKINPMPVISGAMSYPENLEEEIKSLANVIFIDAQAVVEKLGNPKVVNMVLLGVLAKQLHIELDFWLDCIEKTVPKHTVELNKSAFLAGYEYIA